MMGWLLRKERVSYYERVIERESGKVNKKGIEEEEEEGKARRFQYPWMGNWAVPRKEMI